MSRLENASPFPGRSEETLFGFSVRELSAPDGASRARAADRLKALGHVAAAPALATALHAETEDAPLVAMLSALGSVAKAEAAPVVVPHLASRSPDVRIAALKALITVDAAQAVPHMAAAMKDPDRAVRRRASMLALQLRGVPALELGTQGIHDTEGDVRALAALVLGASGNDAARPLLVAAMRDADQRVRGAASQALTRLIGHDVTSLVGLEDRQRAREVRRLTQVEAKPVRASAQNIAARLEQLSPSPRAAGSSEQAIDARAAAAAPQSVRAAAEVRDAGSSAVGTALTAASHAAPPATFSAAAEHSAAPLAVHAPPAARPLSAPARVLAAASAHQSARVAVLEEVQAPLPPQAFASVLGELRAAIRGRTLDELAHGAGLPTDSALSACSALIQRGQVVRRGLKYFVA
jgi:HEAT repeat protein